MNLRFQSSWCLCGSRRVIYQLVLLAGLVLLADSPSAFGAPPPSQSSAELIRTMEAGWPQFRGPRRDGISDEKGLLKAWPDGGPKALWSIEGVGHGFSSPIVVGDKIFISGDVGEEAHLMALDLKGHQLWRATNGLSWKNPYPGARATPTFSGGKIYHQNGHGRIACLNAENGREVWSLELLERFGGKNITWGMSECLLVDERAVYATAGGDKALAVALDKNTGELLWKSAPLHDSEGDRSLENASYVSPILVSFAGRRLLIGCSLRHLFCMDAATGKIQWTRRIPTAYSVLAMMPVLVGDAIFMTAPHGRPGKLYRLVSPAEAGGEVGVEELWTTRLDTCQGSVVHVNGRIYGSYYPGRKGWAALDAHTGEVLYESSEFVKGALLYADERLYALAEDGWMLLLNPTEDAFEINGRFRFAEASSRDAWAHPVIQDGRMYLRYHEKLACYDVRAD
jgi:outer membrane protein assembly factor BamB